MGATRRLVVGVLVLGALGGWGAGGAGAAVMDWRAQSCRAGSGVVLLDAWTVGVGGYRVSALSSGSQTWVCLETDHFNARVILPAPGGSPRVDGRGDACRAQSGAVLLDAWTVGLGGYRVSTLGTGSETWVCFETDSFAMRVLVPTPAGAPRVDGREEACSDASGTVLLDAGGADYQDQVLVADGGSETWVCREWAGTDTRVIVPAAGF